MEERLRLYPYTIFCDKGLERVHTPNTLHVLIALFAYAHPLNVLFHFRNLIKLMFHCFEKEDIQQATSIFPTFRLSRVTRESDSPHFMPMWP